jgi:hypothetical protein
MKLLHEPRNGFVKIMKKITLIIMILGVIIITSAQIEIKYNRFRHSREEYIEIGRDLAHSNSIDCNEKEARGNINLYKSIFYSDTVSVESKQDALYNLSHTNCQEVIDFYEDIIQNDANQKMRKDALLYLGWLIMEGGTNEKNYFFYHIILTIIIKN